MMDTFADTAEELLEKVRGYGATRAYSIKSKSIPLSWKAVMMCLDCKVTTVGWMRRWSCPPHSLSPDAAKKMFARYPHAVVVNLQVPLYRCVNKSWNTSNPFVHLSQKAFCHFYWSQLHRIMLKLRKFFENNSIDSYVWGSSPCHACLKCSFPHRCRKPNEFLVSPEASGIDLYGLATMLGLPIEIPPTRKIQLMSVGIFNE